MKKFICLLLAAVLLPVLSYSQTYDKLNSPRTPIGPNTQIGGELPIPFVASFGPESFESPTFPPTGWTKLNPGGGTGWARITNGTVVPGWGSLVVASAPPGGGTAITFATYINGGATSNDMWIITPQIMNISLSDSLVFWIKKWPGLDYTDNVDIKISTTNNSTPAAFTYTVALLVYPAVNDTAWTRKSYALSSVPGLTGGSNIYVGFREHVLDNLADGDVIGLDLVQLIGLVGIENQNNENPSSYSLKQNYPNPFNPSTEIVFALPNSEFVTLKVYGVLGNEVATVVNEYRLKGTHSVKFDASNLGSGMYFYKIQAGDFSDTKKMTLIK